MADKLDAAEARKLRLAKALKANIARRKRPETDLEQALAETGCSVEKPGQE